MLASRDEAHGIRETGPRLSLQREHTPAFGRQLVVAAATLAGLLDPRTLDPLPLFKTVYDRIQRTDERPA
jgi:hypothetical protein